MQAAAQPNASASVGRVSGVKRKRPPPAQGDAEGVNVAGDPCGPARAFRLPAGKLSQWLLCPPCELQVGCPSHRAGDASMDAAGTLFAAPLTYAVIPGFFLHAPSSSAEQTAGSPRTARGAVCKAPLRQTLKKALDRARDAMGAVDEIPTDALLIAAFAGGAGDGKTPRTGVCRSGAHRPSAARVVNGPRPWCEVAGLCVAGELSRAYRLHRGRAEGCGELGAAEVGGAWCAGHAFCGVRFFWVAEPHRRRGIGRAMVELARQRVSYGFEVPAAHVAFSEPTAHGRLFARRYAGREDFLVF
ncbi:putative peroxisome targeting signal 1 receptor [Trypanosoma conorhini]|uniref:Putative peroxisome targeting signal 1 receptor n=1 Tax=Trypanosoma conorhini TaxID=83891 RepID=A0A3R7NGR8_9TRYP|nr:putative peroxisome targeting signal 1 receptor [Trypanosoma conorhini]RNF06323.1 putative peroxisome targeting signal 1 receptor [Trypanosoma conorhini]